MDKDRFAKPVAVPLAVLYLAVVAFVAACSKPAPDAEPASAGADGTALYAVRGEVITLPDDADSHRGLRLRHEAIDDLKGIDGSVWGMDAMTMKFPLAEGLDLGSIEVGDKVEFTLAVEWLAEPPQQVTQIRELPADTELVFRSAKPPDGS